jgi:acyl carrier protein
MSDNAALSTAEAIAWFAEIFEVSTSEISAQSKQEDIEGWDSMGVLTLMAELDDRFSITLTQDELESISSISDLLDVLKDNNVLVS